MSHVDPPAKAPCKKYSYTGVKRCAQALLTLAVLVSCHEDQTQDQLYEVSFQARDDRGQALAGLAIDVGETALGETDASGLLRVQVSAHFGDRYVLKAPCPQGYVADEAPKEVLFKATTDLRGQEHSSIDLRIVCARDKRVAALLVHAGGYQGMPVLIDGVLSGTTGAQGFAHLRLDREPGTQFEVTLDSSSQPALMPANPTQTMTIGEQDGLFVFDPQFHERPVEKKKRRRARVEAASPPVVKRPIRID